MAIVPRPVMAGPRMVGVAAPDGDAPGKARAWSGNCHVSVRLRGLIVGGRADRHEDDLGPVERQRPRALGELAVVADLGAEADAAFVLDRQPSDVAQSST